MIQGAEWEGPSARSSGALDFSRAASQGYMCVYIYIYRERERERYRERYTLIMCIYYIYI